MRGDVERRKEGHRLVTDPCVHSDCLYRNKALWDRPLASVRFQYKRFILFFGKVISLPSSKGRRTVRCILDDIEVT